MNQSTPSNLTVLQRSALIIAIIACGTVVIAARDFVYPVCIAVLLSYLLFPLSQLLERFLKHRGAAILLSILIGIIISFGFFFILSQQFTKFASDFPDFIDQAISNLTAFQNYISDNSYLSFSSDNWLKDKIVNTLEAQESFIGQIFNATTATLVALGIQPVYVFFMLYYRDHFREFLLQVTKENDHPTIDKIIKEVKSVTRNYVTGVFTVVLILCVLNSVGLIIVGIEYALLFGIVSALLNFIPYFGTLLGGSIPLAYTLVSPEPSHAIGVIILFMIVQVLENNVLTPNITGGRVAINPLFTIFAIMLGGIAWGIPGMFVSVPFLGIFKVVCNNIAYLKPIAFVLSVRSK